ncbi:MAG: hypothetical protein ACK568_12905, partial [Pseudanabaena sp.]
VQAQGDDIDKKKHPGGYSESWARHTPVTDVEGFEFLAKLEGQCSESEKAQRKQAFVKAKRFIKNASNSGGVDPNSQPHSFQDLKRTVSNARVDIEIISGKTFIPIEQKQ